MPKYSVIIPVYNCIPYLELCIDSILAQSIRDFELLLVDDGSTDGSGELCDRLSLRDPRIRVFHKPNGGAASARNMGIENAAGEYLLFIDSDDTIEPDTLVLVDKETANGAELVIFGMAFDYYRGNMLEKTEKLCCAYSGRCTVAELAEEFSDFFDDNALSSSCNKVFLHAPILQNRLRFPEGITLYEDLDFCVAYLSHIRQIGFIKLPLYHYRLHREDNHFHKLVKNEAGLSTNTDILLKTMLTFQTAQTSNAAAHKAVHLHMDLLSLHLLLNRYSVKEIRRVTQSFCSKPDFQKLLEYAPLAESGALNLYSRVMDEQFLQIYFSVLYRRLVRSTKRLIKGILRSVGLRKS